MEVFQWPLYICSTIFGVGWLLCALGLMLFSLLAPKLRSFGILFGSLALGAASLAHMVLAPLQNGVGIPQSQYNVFILPGLSFGDLAAGRVAAFEAAVGVCGLLSALIGGLFTARRIGDFIAQIENIPTSAARSAAIGLAEFRGIVVSANAVLPIEQDWALARIPGENVLEGDDIEVPESYVLVDETRQVTYRRGRTTVTEPMPLWKWSAFYLEDRTGRILIDPRGINFGTPTFAAVMLGAAQTLNLTRNWEATHRGSRSFLKPGDSVHVIGTVQENPLAPADAVDAERLVVRPRNVVNLKYQRPMTESPLVSGSADDLFILSDDHEENLAAALRESRSWVYLTALVLMVLSVIYLGYYVLKL